MAPTLFTLDEANSLLPRLEALLRRLAELHQTFRFRTISGSEPARIFAPL